MTLWRAIAVLELLFCFLARPVFSAQITCEGDISRALYESKGYAELSAGECSVASPIVGREPMTIVGSPDGRTRIRAQRGFVGSRFPLVLRDLSLWRADMLTETGTRAIGINASGAIDAENVSLEGFTVGVYVYADAESFGTNSNAWRLRDLRIMGSAHAGIIVRGRDANGGIGEAIRAMTSCERASKWTKDLGPCAGIVDRSFLGNTWLAPLMSTNAERPPDGSYVRMPPFVSQGASQHSVWIGPYCERDQAAAVTDAGTIVMGGMCTAVGGDGLRIDGRVVNGLIARNAKDPKNVVTMRLGASAASGTFYELIGDAIDPSRPLRTKAEIRGEALSQRCYREDIANQTIVSRVCQDGSRPSQ